MKSTTKLNYYYLPVKMMYKLTKSVSPVEFVSPVIPTNNKELELYLLLNIWDDKSIMVWGEWDNKNSCPKAYTSVVPRIIN